MGSCQSQPGDLAPSTAAPASKSGSMPTRKHQQTGSAATSPRDVVASVGVAPGASKLSRKEAVAATRGTQEWILGETEDIRKTYDFGEVLGKGQFGTTRRATLFSTGQQYAIKSISKRTLKQQDELEDVRREVQVLHHLAGHPNVVQLKGVFEDKLFVHIVMELAEGGELFERIVQRGRYSEKDAADLFRTMVGVVVHCHGMGVMHRDLKPENFLLADKSPHAQLKATDFGLSRFFKEGQEFTDIVGSAYYVAPEVLKCCYGKEADIWSLGVILYILLCGAPPFNGDTEQEIFKEIRKGELELGMRPWPSISDPAKDCLRRMLVKDPRRRASAVEILEHPWVRVDGVASDKPIQSEVLGRLQGFSNMNKLKKEALKMIAGFLPENEIMGLRELFKSLDVDGSGTITITELREGLRKKGTRIPVEDVERLVMNTDVNGDGTIDYEEFLAATMNRSKLDQDEYLFKAFQELDKDGSGTITREELMVALKASGTTDMEEIEAIIKEVDVDGDGQIDYSEFCAMLRASNDPAPSAGKVPRG